MLFQAFMWLQQLIQAQMWLIKTLLPLLFNFDLLSKSLEYFFFCFFNDCQLLIFFFFCFHFDLNLLLFCLLDPLL